MKLPGELIRKFRVSQIIINDERFYCAQAFDFSLNKVVLLTVLGDIEHALFDTIKERFKLERKDETLECILDVYALEYLSSKEMYYTQELGTALINVDPITIVEGDLVRDWFYKLALPVFFNFLDVSKQKNMSHGFLSPKTIYYSNGNIKIGDYILGIILDLNPQLIMESPWFYNSFFSAEQIGNNTDAYSLLKMLQFIDTDNYSKIMQMKNYVYNHTEFSVTVKEVVNRIYAGKKCLADNYLSEMHPFLSTYNLLNKERVLYKPEQLPLLYSILSSWDMNMFDNVIVIHINHYLKDILEFNRVLASIFEKLVYVVVPYSMETKIVPNQLYHTYYHEVNKNKYIIKKDSSSISSASDFYSAMYESIKLALKNEVVNLVGNGKKILIIEDGGFHYNVIDELISSYPNLKNAIIGAIEQTTSGVKRYKEALNKSSIPYPVLSVARSKIKMRIESHFIARRVIDELNYLLYITNNFLSFHNVLIMGYGIIGRNISKALSVLKCNILIYDIEECVLSLAKRDGMETIDDVQNIRFIDNLIIIGATGESAFTPSMFFSFVTSTAKKIFLASASSKRIEFQNIVNFFEYGDKDANYKQIIDKIENIRIEQRDYGIVYNFTYKNIAKKIVLIANGYPVNFYRKNVISLTESVIDLVYCEIILLVGYLLKAKLSSKLYLLGSGDFNSLDIEEEQLVRNWFDLLCLHLDDTESNIWEKFDVHPLEDFLRGKCLLDKEKENE